MTINRISTDPIDNWLNLGYAYPSSETATKNGYGKTGCYVVSFLYSGENEVIERLSFQYGYDALEYCNLLASYDFKPLHFSFFGGCESTDSALARIERMRNDKFKPTAKQVAEEEERQATRNAANDRANAPI